MKLRLAVGRSWPDVEHVYSVGYRGLMAGRVWLATDRRGSRDPWEWCLCIPLSLPDDSKGLARSKGEALQALANSLARLMAQTPHERLERAFAFAAATGLSFDDGEEVELSADETVSAPAPPVQRVEVHAGQAAVAPPVRRVAVTQVGGVTQVQAPKVVKRGPVVRVQVAKPAQLVMKQPVKPVARGPAPTSEA